MSELLRAEGLKKTYRLDEVEVRALRGVDLTIEPGDYIAIVGPSGCGKSTLLHLLGCVDGATEGKVFYNGRDVTAFNDAELTRIRSRDIGFIFQTFNLMPTLTAQENVSLQLRLSGKKVLQRQEWPGKHLKKSDLPNV